MIYIYRLSIFKYIMSCITCECGCEVKQSYHKKHLLTMKHTTLLNSIEKKLSGDLNLICESDLANFTKHDVIQSIQRVMAKRGGHMTNLYSSKLDGLIKVINKYKIPLEDISKDEEDKHLVTEPNMIFTINEIYVSKPDNNYQYNLCAYQVVSVTKCFVKFREIYFRGLDFQNRYPAPNEFKDDEIITKKIESYIFLDSGSNLVLWKSGMTYDRTHDEFSTCANERWKMIKNDTYL